MTFFLLITVMIDFFLNKMGMEEKNKLRHRFEALYIEK